MRDTTHDFKLAQRGNFAVPHARTIDGEPALALAAASRYISRDTLLARSAPQVTVSADVTYGMGLQVNRRYGTPVVHHGGDMIGYHSDMMWLPEHGVGAVVLTNGDPGWIIRDAFPRKLLTVPADPTAAEQLAPRYAHPAVGGIAVTRSGANLLFDFGEWASDVASRRNPDGTTSFITTVPGFTGLEFVAGKADSKRTLTLRDAQHEYVLVEQ